MTSRRWIGAVLLAGMALLAGPARAATPEAGAGITVQDATARPTAPRQRNGVVYFKLVNKGAEADELQSVSTPVAGMAGLHQSTVDAGGVARMSALPALAVPAGETVELSPGGTHIMLMDLRRPLQPGQSFPLSLTFRHAGTMTIEVSVAGGKAAPMPPMSGMND